MRPVVQKAASGKGRHNADEASLFSRHRNRIELHFVSNKLHRRRSGRYVRVHVAVSGRSTITGNQSLGL